MAKKENRAPENADALDGMITDGAMRLVEETIDKYKTKNRYEILQHLCDDMEKKYPGESLEYHLSQMKMRTTSEILDIIDIFLIMIELDPDTTFKRRPRSKRKKKDCAG